MKLNISETEAFIYSLAFASLFVLSVYIWKPLVTPPAEIIQIWLKKWYHLRPSERRLIEDYEMRMRTKSVGTLMLMAMAFLIARSHLGERPEVGVIRWFGLQINLQTLKSCFWVLVLNSLLFAGEIWQMARGYAAIMY